MSCVVAAAGAKLGAVGEELSWSERIPASAGWHCGFRERAARWLSAVDIRSIYLRSPWRSAAVDGGLVVKALDDVRIGAIDTHDPDGTLVRSSFSVSPLARPAVTPVDLIAIAKRDPPSIR
jgi:hypothetical protein